MENKNPRYQRGVSQTQATLALAVVICVAVIMTAIYCYMYIVSHRTPAPSPEQSAQVQALKTFTNEFSVAKKQGLPKDIILDQDAKIIKDKVASSTDGSYTTETLEFQIQTPLDAQTIAQKYLQNFLSRQWVFLKFASPSAVQTTFRVAVSRYEEISTTVTKNSSSAVDVTVEYIYKEFLY